MTHDPIDQKLPCSDRTGPPSQVNGAAASGR